MAGYTVKPRGWSLCLGPSDPWIELWITVKLKRLGVRKMPHGVGGEIRWHPCFFWPSNLMEIMVKPVIKCLLCWPSDPGWMTVNLDFY